MYRRDKVIKEVAEKRLSAIREFTELGSGYKISLKDLEIRGAGNVLGSSQSGHMEEIGYDLYVKLLNQAIKSKMGDKVEEDFDTSVDLPVDAYIPDEYVRNEYLKLELYKRISHIESEDDLADIGILKACGVGVAVDNALPQVKAAADQITASCDEDGVARWIGKNLLKEE